MNQSRYKLRPIGFVRSRLESLADAPRQGEEGAPDAWLDLLPGVRTGLAGIQVGDILLVLTWLHRASRDVLQVHPRGDLRAPLTGVFATRSPDRPNPIGLHQVRVLEVGEDSLKIAPMEAVDGTPVLDIKPVLPPVHDRLQADTVSLRPATLEDVPGITALVNAAYSRYVDRIGMLPRPMTDDYAEVVRRSRVTIAGSDGVTAGVIVLDVTSEGFVVDNLAVHPACQNRGIGRLLLQFAEQEARQAGFGSIYLYTHEKMIENQALYARCGYVEYDRRPQGDFSLVYMRKVLGGTG